jgi:hypothetical protein
MLANFPNFNLEDKINANGGSIVRNTVNNECILWLVMMSHDVPCIGRTSGDMATTPTLVEVRRSNWIKKPNPKYYVK